ncbi:MAG: adenosine deaminase [Anaerotignum sp.]
MKYTYPKIELHLHLDGSIRPETVWELYQKEGLAEDGMDFETFTRDAAVLEPCQDVNDCLTKFDLPLKIMQDAAYITRITKELVCDLAEQGVIYGEIRFAPQLHTQKGLSQREAIEAVLKGKDEGLKEHPKIGIGIILCCMSIGLETVNKEENLETVRLGKEYLGKGVNAIDLAGAEGIVPLRNFHYIFDLARELGVPFTCHGGDSQDYETVRDAMDFGSVRIGHGHAVYEAPELCQRAIREGITFEICPTSNIRCQSRESYAAHPAKKLLDMGIRVTINTDNMTIFNVDLDEEYDHCLNDMGFTEEDILQMLLYAAEAAFLPAAEKAKLVAKVKAYQK